MTWPLRLLALNVLLLTACTSTSPSSSGGAVPYPEGYRDWTHVRSMVIEESHPLFESFGGIHHVYANGAALKGLKRGDGRYADGAVFAFDLLEARADGSAVTEGDRKVLGVMHRNAKRHGETGGWGFAGFAGDTRENVVADGGAGCFACHAPQEASGYVFSTWRR